MKRHNDFYKILSIFIAIFLWLYVFIEVSPNTTNTFEGVKIQLENTNVLENRGMAITDISPAEISVTVEGKRGNFSHLKARDILAAVDCADLNEGTNVVSINLAISDNYKIISKKPRKVSVRVEKKIAEKRSVQVKIHDNLNSDREIGRIDLNPKKLRVSGARSLVKKVDHLEVYLNRADTKNENVVRSVYPIAVDRFGKKVERVKVLGGKVKVTAEVLNVKAVPFEVDVKGQAKKGFKIVDISIPRSIYIKGKRSDLGKISKVSALPISVEGVEKDGRAKAVLNFDPGIELSNKNPEITVSYKVKPLSSKNLNFKNEEIEIEGSEQIRIINEEIRLILYGEKHLLDNLNKDDVKLYIIVDEQEKQGGQAELKIKNLLNDISYEIEPALVVYEKIKEQ